MPIKVSAQKVLLAEASVIDVDAMKPAATAHDRRGCLGRRLALPLTRPHRLYGRGQARGHELPANSISLKLASTLDHLRSDQHLLL